MMFCCLHNNLNYFSFRLEFIWCIYHTCYKCHQFLLFTIQSNSIHAFSLSCCSFAAIWSLILPPSLFCFFCPANWTAPAYETFSFILIHCTSTFFFKTSPISYAVITPTELMSRHSGKLMSNRQTKSKVSEPEAFTKVLLLYYNIHLCLFLVFYCLHYSDSDLRQTSSCTNSG